MVRTPHVSRGYLPYPITLLDLPNLGTTDPDLTIVIIFCWTILRPARRKSRHLFSSDRTGIPYLQEAMNDAYNFGCNLVHVQTVSPDLSTGLIHRFFLVQAFT